MQKDEVDPLAKELDERRRALNIRANAMLKEAGVSAATHWGWFNGAEAKRSTIRRCHEALDKLAKVAAS